MSTHRYTGVVVNRATQAGISGLRVEAWDARHVVRDALAATDTTGDGSFVLAVSDELLAALFPSGGALLSFRVIDLATNGVLASTERSTTWNPLRDERGRIEVEDVPFLAVGVTAEGEGRDQRLIFRTNLDEFVTAGPENPLRVEAAASNGSVPYIRVRDRLEARLARPVFYELVELGTEERADDAVAFGVWSGGMFFRLGEPGPDWE